MPERNSLLLPIAIVIGGAIVGLAIFFWRSGDAHLPPEGNVSDVRPVGPTDHSLGNPEADIVIITYSDIDCAYCKQFHTAMEQLMAEYGPSGKVLWVMRHFPIVEIHGNAVLHAEAAECAALQGGNDAFFRFIDALHQAAPENEQFDPRGYEDAALSIGLNGTTLRSCVESTRFESKIAADYDDGLAVGVNGTPYSLLMVGDKKPAPLSGAIPYPAMKQIIERAIQGN